MSESDNIAIVDTETTGMDHARDRVIEIGVVLVNIDHAAVVSCFSSLIRDDGQPPDSEKINRIPSSLLPLAPEPLQVWGQVRRYVDASKAICAHNADFDRAFVPEDIRNSKPWICTQDDLSWPNAGDGKSLISIALAHGVGVSHAHRALTDCMLIARLFERLKESGVDLRAFLRRGLRPKAKFKALVSYDTNHLAKAAGFRWTPDRKMWLRSMAIEDTKALPFQVQKIEDSVSPSAVGGPLFDDPLSKWNEAAS